MSEPAETIWDRLQKGVDGFLAGASIAREALRKVARKKLEPELIELGMNHIDPFTPAGELALLKARNRRAAEQRAQDREAMRAFWDEHDRQMRLPLSERYPELLVDDTTPDPEGVVTGRYHPLETMRSTPESSLAPPRGVKQEDVDRHFELLRLGELSSTLDQGGAE